MAVLALCCFFANSSHAGVFLENGSLGSVEIASNTNDFPATVFAGNNASPVTLYVTVHFDVEANAGPAVAALASSSTFIGAGGFEWVSSSRSGEK